MKKWKYLIPSVPLLILLTLPLAALQPPVRDYTVSSGVGYRVNPMGGGEESLHRGIDIPGLVGTPILAAGSGVVKECWPAPGQKTRDGRTFRGHPVFGGYVIIDHGGGILTEYGHMSWVEVRTGQRVEAGAQIGQMGATGKCTGPHLHFALIVDPCLFFESPLGLAERGRKELLR